jgi:hypothetical protein
MDYSYLQTTRCENTNLTENTTTSEVRMTLLAIRRTQIEDALHNPTINALNVWRR